MKDRSEYQKNYYLSHKGERSVKRKERYHADAEYRKKCIEQSRRSAKRRAEKLKMDREAGIVPMPKKSGVRYPVDVYFMGGVVKAYSVSQLADYIGRNKNSVKNWIKDGVIPETPLRHHGRVRLYTEPMMNAVKFVFARYGRIKGKNRNEICDDIISSWKQLGIFDE